VKLTTLDKQKEVETREALVRVSPLSEESVRNGSNSTSGAREFSQLELSGPGHTQQTSVAEDGNAEDDDEEEAKDEEDSEDEEEVLEMHDAFDSTRELVAVTSTPGPRCDQSVASSATSGTSDGDYAHSLIDYHHLERESDSDTEYSVENLDLAFWDLGLPSQLECFPRPLGPQTHEVKTHTLDKNQFYTYREGVRHNAWTCEYPGCVEAFYWGGGHHCRICGVSVCGAHCRQNVQLPTALLVPVHPHSPSSTPVLSTAVFRSLPKQLEFSRACLLCCENSCTAEQRKLGHVPLERALELVRAELEQCHREIQLLSGEPRGSELMEGFSKALVALGCLEALLCDALTKSRAGRDVDVDASEQLWDSPSRQGRDVNDEKVSQSGEFGGEFDGEFGAEVFDDAEKEEEEEEGTHGAQEARLRLSIKESLGPCTPSSGALISTLSDSLGSTTSHSLCAALDRALHRREVLLRERESQAGK